ncbi:putative teichuronic acid biosynthesis glycosyltransferase tuaG [Vibrio coralliirubri]|uniref:glycosyltransferase family 2 protein n=1 Tax=Vibrio coralliirubri TaxID=1516159 RepID=UPI00062F062D|nr:glycosyltransferase family 2 protein [Vibrio coralliirubri]CDU00000.1 putative teichuronic acid biosynthesis glycosyltransferase tuaG [Vibrio coralliirubri]
MLVSIITPSYNSQQYITNTYESIREQTVTDWEWLVTDDCSNDGTYELLLDIAQVDPRVRVFRNEENQGAGYSRNNSIRQSKGRYIAFLDADDLWLPTKLYKQIKFMVNNNVAFSYTRYQKFTSAQDKGIVIPPDSVTYSELLYGNVIGCLTAMYDTESVGKQYMPLIRKRQDMGLWLNILKLTPKAYCIQENLAKYRIDSGMTQNKLKILHHQWAFYRNVVKLSYTRTIFVFIFYVIKGFRKHRV